MKALKLKRLLLKTQANQRLESDSQSQKKRILLSPNIIIDGTLQNLLLSVLIKSYLLIRINLDTFSSHVCFHQHELHASQVELTQIIC